MWKDKGNRLYSVHVWSRVRAKVFLMIINSIIIDWYASSGACMHTCTQVSRGHECAPRSARASKQPCPRNPLACSFWLRVRGCCALPKSNSGQEQDKGLYRIVQADSSIRDCVRMYVYRCTWGWQRMWWRPLPVPCWSFFATIAWMLKQPPAVSDCACLDLWLVQFLCQCSIDQGGALSMALH